MHVCSLFCLDAGGERMRDPLASNADSALMAAVAIPGIENDWHRERHAKARASLSNRGIRTFLSDLGDWRL